jgi:Ca2+/Na+ antiporter
MGNHMVPTLIIVLGLLSMLEPFLQRRQKGFYEDSIIYYVILLTVLYFISFGSSSKVDIGNVALFTVYFAVILVFKAYTIGNKIIFKTGCSNYGVQDKLVEALEESNIKYEIDNTEAKNIIIIKKYFCSITIKTSIFNTDSKTVSFKGWVNYINYLQIRNAFMQKMKENIVVTNREQRYPILGGIALIATGVLMLCFL